MVHEVSRTEELAERRRARSADHAGLEVEEHRAWYVFAARGLVVKHVDAAELRVVVAALLLAAADAVLAAQNLLKLSACLATSLARLRVNNLSRRNSLKAGSTREKKGRGGAEKLKKLRVVVWHGKQEMPVVRARVYPEQENKVILPLLPLEIWTPCKAQWVWAGAVIFASATCSLQFAEASAAMLSQQEKNNSVDVR